MVDDVPSLETEWVKSSKPYPISLNLRQIKNILKMDQSMDADCFNMVVRILACNEIHLFRDIPVHYMDLNFCTMSNFARDPSGRGRLDFDQISKLFHSWPNNREYHISECDKDDFELRKRFVVHLLKYQDNEAINNIPILERGIIDRIKRWTF
ncbi:unnamed protein product [Alopecurus aequalis]